MCPVRDQCLIFALVNNEKSGVWGGASELGRRWLRKKWPLKGKEPRPEWQWDAIPTDSVILQEWGVSSLEELESDEEIL